MDYGIEAPGEFGRPARAGSIRLIQEAADAGINLFDTAPAYGDSERLLGEALRSRPWCHVSTKVCVPANSDVGSIRGPSLRRALFTSLESSLHALRRDALDIVQIHNATVEVIAQGEVSQVLLDARQQGKVRFLGASIYTEAEALAAIEAGCFEVLQVPYNVLDQRMAARVFPSAERAGVGIVIRSALLKGALTAKAQWLPQELAELRRAAERARDVLAGSWESLPEMALRFCLSATQAAAILIGARALEELRQALRAIELGPLATDMLVRTGALTLEDERLFNPSQWPVA